MRSLILGISLLGSAGAANNEIDGLVFGVSHHFQNRDEYNFNEFNPGTGFMYFHKFENFNHGYNSDAPLYIVFGGALGQYKNSYYNTSSVMEALFKLQYDFDDKWHAGFIGGIGKITGYYPSAIGLIGAFSVGYDRYNIDFTYMPISANERGQPPGSSCVAIWARIKLCEF
jgi:hypothetical protein